MAGAERNFIKENFVAGKSKVGEYNLMRQADTKDTGRKINKRVWVSNPTATKWLKAYSSLSQNRAYFQIQTHRHLVIFILENGRTAREAEWENSKARDNFTLESSSKINITGKVPLL
jgi:hypothetical protein